MSIFIVCGYGVPENIETDQNYLTYLAIVFNTIYARAASAEATIIPAGGATNCTPPFEGTEAEAIGAYLGKLARRAEVVTNTKSWNIALEDRSLSTLENLLFAKERIEELGLFGPVTIFCEATREMKVQTLGDAIFDEPVDVIVVDFDLSSNRYLDPALIEKKERLATEEGLRSINDPEVLKAHHAFFENKLTFLRKRQSEGLSHVEAVEEWMKQVKSL